MRATKRTKRLSVCSSNPPPPPPPPPPPAHSLQSVQCDFLCGGLWCLIPCCLPCGGFRRPETPPHPTYHLIAAPHPPPPSLLPPRTVYSVQSVQCDFLCGGLCSLIPGGLRIEVFPGTETTDNPKYFVMAATPTRHYQFIGN